MVISANQPYFCPFPGFFRKVLASDTMVILDEVQFPRGTMWISRNRFKNNQGTYWMTIPVWKKGLGMQRISQVRICQEDRWAHKHLESIKSAYKNAPYLADHIDFITEMFSGNFEKLIDLNMTIIRYLMKSLRIDTRLLLLSELGVTGKGTNLLIEICNSLGATTFLAQKQAVRFHDPGTFQNSGVKLRFFHHEPPIYPQLWGDFLPNLSTFDLLFNCGPKSRDILLGHRHNSPDPG